MMKKFLQIVSVALIVFSCKTEGDVDPAKEATFVRYLGSENNNVAVSAKETSDGGYTLLSYSEIQGTSVGLVNYQIKLIHLDQFGNLVWERNYPETPTDKTETFHSKASAFIELSNSGYLIIGEGINEGINAERTKKIQLIKVDAEGNGAVYNSITDLTPTVSLSGSAVIEDSNGDFVILAKIADNGSNDMYIAKLNSAALQTEHDNLNLPVINNPNLVWSRKYGAGLSSLVNRLYKSSVNANYFWGGSVLNSVSLKNDVRIVRVQEDSEIPVIGNPLGEDNIDESAKDICVSTGGWGITGAVTDATNNGDIYVMKVSNNSEVLFKTVLSDTGNTPVKQEGVAITKTNDEGFAVLANVATGAKQDDLSLIKINASGLVEWQHNFGSSEKQEGASVTENSDGSLLVFGTTYFGDVKKLMLMKVNKNGEL